MQLKIKMRTFEPKLKNDISGYLQGVRDYGLSAIETYKKRYKKS